MKIKLEKTPYCSLLTLEDKSRSIFIINKNLTVEDEWYRQSFSKKCLNSLNVQLTTKTFFNGLITRITSININGCSSTQRYSNHAQGKQLKNVFEMSNHRQLKLSYHKILK